LLIAQSIENPPGDHEVQEQVNDPDGMHPVDPSKGTRLQHFADTSQHGCHAQSEND
jgi:hypothetical protein